MKNYEYKPTTKCPRKDELGVHQQVFTDRVCDGHRDCPNGEDEDGTLGECYNSTEVTPQGCCMNIIANHKYANDCTRSGELNGKDTYNCVVFKVILHFKGCRFLTVKFNLGTGICSVSSGMGTVYERF